jgi:hypothetical protein
MTKTGWQCERGHQWQAVYYNIQAGKGCPHCMGTARKTPADYEALAAKKGFTWLGPEVTNTGIKTGWQCEQGHQWQAAYHIIQARKHCPHCVNYKRKTPADYRALAAKRGFTWLGPEVANVMIKTGWQCQRGHQWQARYESIRAGSGCPHCPDLRAKTPADYEALAATRGFVWLGPEVANTLTKTGWQCEHGHQWQAIHGSIRAGIGCPHCANRARKTPADYRALAAKRGFTWLGPEVANVSTKTGWQCGQGHQWQAVYYSIHSGRGCPHCANRARKTPADYEALAAKRGFVWLGPEVANAVTKTGWQCGRGHQWQAAYGNIHTGSGCPHCAGVVSKTSADYEALATTRGFTWLGPEVANASTKTGWQCGQGHQWQAAYYNIQAGKGCPYCANRIPKTPADYEALAAKRGFVWLGPEVPNIRTVTGWQCGRGHQWQATYHDIRQGTGCPHCANRKPQAVDN